MNFAMLSAVSGGLAALDRLDAITTNLANISTAGFKGVLHSQMSDHAGSARPSEGAPSTPISRSRMVSDLSQGGLERTGDPLHLALDGRGFFVVDTPQGERLTRRGSFAIDEEGFLSTPEGFRVQGDGGDLDVGAAGQRGEPVIIGNDGSVQIEGSTIGQIRVVDPGDESALHREPGGLYRTSAEQFVAADQGTYTVRQGAIEKSNVSAVENLVAMIEAMRGFEAYMNALDRVDTINERSIRDVGRV